MRVQHTLLISSPCNEFYTTKITTSVVSTVYSSKFDASNVELHLDQWFVVMSTQLIGFSIGGIARRFLVAPPSMIWPANLINCALFNTLHSQQYTGIGTRGGISRERFFIYGCLGSFAWCESSAVPNNTIVNPSLDGRFFPGLSLCVKTCPVNLWPSHVLLSVVQALSYFSWVTWIRPDDPSTLFCSQKYFALIGPKRLLHSSGSNPFSPLLFYIILTFSHYRCVHGMVSFMTIPMVGTDSTNSRECLYSPLTGVKSRTDHNFYVMPNALIYSNLIALSEILLRRHVGNSTGTNDQVTHNIFSRVGRSQHFRWFRLFLLCDLFDGLRVEKSDFMAGIVTPIIHVSCR